ncbi:MAG: hypothetical protein K5648_00210 [Erysipelotrichaceae bacterium]|nr:hypothetical protein [Erysipelotrichaceae bacterium]
MTEAEFRIEYSRLIEYYQYIEMRLRYLCAEILTDNEWDWFLKLDDFESDPFGVLIKKIRTSQSQKSIESLNQEDLIVLDEIREARNYWVHKAFGGDYHVTFNRKGELRDPEYGKRLRADLLRAVEWDEKLTEICFDVKQVKNH